MSHITGIMLVEPYFCLFVPNFDRYNPVSLVDQQLRLRVFMS